jgi:hypothetical protein
VLPSALHQEVELCGTRESSSKDHWLVTLGSCRSLDGLEKVISWSLSKDHWLVTLGSCRSLDGLEKVISWSFLKEIVEEPRFRL